MDDFDNTAIGETFKDEYGGEWLKLSETRSVRVMNDFDELNSALGGRFASENTKKH